MRSVIWESDNGHVIELAPSQAAAFVFGGLEGNNVSGVMQADAAPGQDGQLTQGASLGPRPVIVSGYVQGMGSKTRDAQAAFDEAVNRLCMAFNPKYEGRLIYNLYEKQVFIRARPKALPSVQKRYVNTAQAAFSVDLVADYPIWQEMQERVIVLGVTYPNMRFPLFISRDGGTPASLVYNLLRAENPTSEPIYPVIEVFGTVTLIRLDNKLNGKFLQINRPIAQNQKVRIDTLENEVLLYEQNAAGAYEYVERITNWITPESFDSWPFTLSPGANDLEVNNNVSGDAPVSVVRYRLPVMGVAF